MNRCIKCVIPDTRPDTQFVNGVCSACISFEKRKTIDWDARKRDLAALLERGKNGSGYDCIVPSSGGKDSHFQVLTLISMGARPLVVTATTCHLTPIGRANIDNLARYATTIEVTPNREVRRYLNRAGLELVGDVSWPEHGSIFTVPLRMAAKLGIPLVFYGENPQREYGGPVGADEARQMTRRWVSEFGGFNGLRPSDFVGKYKITAAEMADYELPSTDDLEKAGIEAHFLGQYMPWDSLTNAEIAKEAGMRCLTDKAGKEIPPCEASLWPYENVDNAQTGLHDHFMYRKFGFGRLAQQVSVDIRNGRMARAQAMELVRERDGVFPRRYAGVDFATTLGQIGIGSSDMDAALAKFTNRDLFDRIENDRPILQEFAEVM